MDKTHTPDNLWFVKARRAQTTDDYETWVEGGVSPTLNIFDNNGDTRATVLILMRWREGKPGGGKGALLSENKSLTLATANDQVLFCYSIREDATANNFSATLIETRPALQALRPSVQSHHAQTFITQEIPVNDTVVRRLTPIECERLQGFPDNWTAQRIDKNGQLVEQKDSARYKQMGNAVAVPCVQWLLGRIVEQMGNV